MPNYEQPNGTVKNKLGARTHDELESRETAFVQGRSVEISLGGGTAKRSFDLDHLKAIHRHLFQDVFEFAGATRHEPVRLSDGTVATMPTMARPGSPPFAPSALIERSIQAVAADIHKTRAEMARSPDAFADVAANYLAIINTVHPFREGNGRTQRTFISQLAEAHGHKLDWSPITRERMAVASIAAHERRDIEPLRRVLEDAIHPERGAFLAQNIAELKTVLIGAGKTPAEASKTVNGLYIAGFTPGHATTATFKGVGPSGFLAIDAERRHLFGDKRDLPSPPPQREETFTLTIAPRQPARERGADHDRGAADRAPAPTKDELRAALDKAERDGASKAQIDKARAAYHDSLKPKSQDRDIER